MSRQLRQPGLRDERGQAIVLTVLFLTVLLGMAALVLDVGSWFQAQRKLQATADAAALAGAQALPDYPGTATALALHYADENGGGLQPADVSLSSDLRPNDTIAVHTAKGAQTFFSRLFGFDVIPTGARATARSAGISQARWVAPMVVSKSHPLLAGPGCPCFKVATTLPFSKEGAPGAFGMLDLAGDGGAVGSSAEAFWISRGFDKYLPLGDYDSDPGAKFSSSNVKDALTSRLTTALLFPVFSKLVDTGSNAKYTIVGWVGFHLTGYKVAGNNATLTGWFTRYLATGIQSTSAASQPDFGVRSIQLVK